MNCVCMLSCFSHIWLFVTPWTVAHQALCAWGSPGKNTGVGCHVLLQGISLSRDWTCISYVYLHWQVGSLPLVPPGKWTILQFILQFILQLYFKIDRDFLGSSVVKNLHSNTRDTSLIPGWGTKISHVLGPPSPHTATTEAHVLSRIWNEDPAHPKLKKNKVLKTMMRHKESLFFWRKLKGRRGLPWWLRW